MSQPPPPSPVGRVFSPSLVALRQCMVIQLLEIGRPVCNLPLYWGDAPISPQRCTCSCDNGGQGEGWIRIVRAERVSLAGQRTRNGFVPTNCADTDAAFDVTVEMGVWRCAAALDVEPPADTVYDDHTLGMVDDMAALQRAWRCCDWFDRRNIRRQSDQSLPLGPAGGCVGVAVTGHARLADCVPCPTDEPAP